MVILFSGKERDGERGWDVIFCYLILEWLIVMRVPSVVVVWFRIVCGRFILYEKLQATDNVSAWDVSLVTFWDIMNCPWSERDVWRLIANLWNIFTDHETVHGPNMAQYPPPHFDSTLYTPISPQQHFFLNIKSSTWRRKLTKASNWNVPLQSILHFPILRLTATHPRRPFSTCFMWYFIHCIRHSTLTPVPPTSSRTIL